MTIDRTRARTEKRTEVMERIGNRIKLEHKDILILVISLENPQELRTSAWDVENMNTSQGKGVLPRMPSAKTVIKLDISTKYARARTEPPREPTLFKPPKMLTTPTLMKMESHNQIHLQG